MVGVVLGPGRNWSSLCHQSTRYDVGNVVVPWPSPETSPAASYRRSARESPWSAREEGDDRWGQGVSDSVLKMEFFYFAVLNE